MTAGVVLAAVVALARHDTRTAVLRAWVVVVAALGLVAVLAAGSYSTAASPIDQPLWLGFPLVVAQAAAITAAALAGTGIRRRLAGSSFGWRQPVGVVVVALAALTPVVSAVWWVWSGSAGPLDRSRATTIPTYMTDAAAADPGNGILVVRGSRVTGFGYVLVRQPGTRVGDDSVMPSAVDQEPLTGYVEDLVTAPAAGRRRRPDRAGRGLRLRTGPRRRHPGRQPRRGQRDEPGQRDQPRGPRLAGRGGAHRRRPGP